jgi:hypothetical protein
LDKAATPPLTVDADETASPGIPAIRSTSIETAL